MSSLKESKMDMSLDQIINLEKKRQGRGGQSRGRGRGAVRGRRGGLKVGVSVGLRGRRIGKAMATSSSFASNRAGRQRIAQNLVKRAMLQRRRQAVGQRREANTAGFAGQTEKSQRLLQEVRRWRKTAQVLQNALHHQQQGGSSKKVQLRRSGNRFVNTGLNRPSIQNRLGWRGRGNGRRGRGSVITPTSPIRQQSLPQNRVTLSRGTLAGQMQSDIIAREQIRQQRLTNEILSRALQNIAATTQSTGGRARRGGYGGGRGRGRGRLNIEIAQTNVSRRFGQVGGGSPRFRQVRTIDTNVGSARRNFRGRGGFNSPLRSSNSDTLNVFRSGSSSGTTLNERFGGSGGSGSGLGFGGQRGRRGRGRGGRGRSRQYNY